MRRRRRVCTALLAAFGLAVFPLSSSFGQSAGVFEGPVPRADCGPGSRPETALQGEVTIADRESGRSAQGYWCNLEVVGNYGPDDGFEGAQWQLAGYGDCAYYGTRLHGRQQTRGTIVVDASEPANPKFSTNLTSPAMLDAWESLKVHPGRGLLGGVLGGGAQPVPSGWGYFDVYDVATDCAHPRLLASLPVNGMGHEGEWAPDGRTYYATGISPGMVTAIDVSNPAAPSRITTFFASALVHGLGVSQDGRRLYLAHVNEDWPTGAASQSESATASNGLGIYDVSEIAERAPNPQVKLVGKVTWNDGQVGQHAFFITSRGQPYVVFVDEISHGGARIIDISDERNPRVISKLKLEIQMPENRQLAQSETSYNNENGGLYPLGYNSHYCSADRLVDPTILACGNQESGLRVFDIRDVRAPREIAYFNPGGNGVRAPGSWAGTTSGYVSAQPRIDVERGQIWFTDQDRGFHIVRFTNDTWPFLPPRD